MHVTSFLNHLASSLGELNYLPVRREGKNREATCVTHSPRSGEVSTVHHALPHLAVEQANTYTLQVLWGDL